MIAGKRYAGKLARTVWEGAVGKGPAPQEPRRRPTSLCESRGVRSPGHSPPIRVHRPEGRSRADQTAPGPVRARGSQAGTVGRQDADHARPHPGRAVPRLRHHRPAQPEPSQRQRRDRAARPQGGDRGQDSPLPQARQTVAPARADEPGRPGDHQRLRSRIPGAGPVLPARRERLPAAPAQVGSGNLSAQDAGGKAPLDGDEDGPQVQGHGHHPARAPDLLRGPHRAARQEATGGTVRRHPAQTAQTGGPR